MGTLVAQLERVTSERDEVAFSHAVQQVFAGHVMSRRPDFTAERQSKCLSVLFEITGKSVLMDVHRMNAWKVRKTV